ncbi:MCE family protein [Flavobacterium sp. CYK-4]|uniref:MlaD family protein n=1 Tax=Flavobacterium lotistagni TaxID=2709660 RepID=UPI0014081C59|nr:MlaD family protein [Flavobacterium lotistagni]NHM06800.1 MCE family protein [Flavobacterium lotistagni]
MKITREIKTAILVIASILLFIWGYSFLKGRDLFTSYKTLYVQYDNVEGLTASAPITLNGLVIGKVNSIKFSGSSGKLEVEMQIKSDFPISKSSLATIYESGLIGGKQIMIVPNLKDTNMTVNGDHLQSDVKLGLTDMAAEKLAPLQEKLDRILSNADKMLVGINNVLDAKGQQDLKNTLSELSQTIAQFHQASEKINGLLADNKSNINGMMGDFKKVSSNFSAISDSLKQANLGKTAKDLQLTLRKVDEIMAGLNSGKGTAGKLLKDEALYNNFTKTSKELELLLQDLRLNPTRYVNVSLFGKKNKPYVAPPAEETKENK